MEEGLKIFQDFWGKIIADIHEIYQCQLVADVVDIIKLPVFLVRQTDLVEAMVQIGAMIKYKRLTFYVSRFFMCKHTRKQ